MISASLFTVLFAVAVAATNTKCPLVKPVQTLDLDEWVRASWYIQEQQTNGYQASDSLHCVVATYNLSNRTVPFFKGNVLRVDNYDNIGEVNGKEDSTDNIPFGGGLCARQVDNSMPGMLVVAPCFLPNFLGGPFWIVGLGTDYTGKYTWAVVSAGTPTVEYEDGCTTAEKGTNGAGLWILTRDSLPNKNYIAEAHSQLKNLGFTTQRLQKVAQEGCLYKNAHIKGGD